MANGDFVAKVICSCGQVKKFNSNVFAPDIIITCKCGKHYNCSPSSDLEMNYFEVEEEDLDRFM